MQASRKLQEFAQQARRGRNSVVELASKREDGCQCSQLGVDNWRGSPTSAEFQTVHTVQQKLRCGHRRSFNSATHFKALAEYHIEVLEQSRRDAQIDTEIVWSALDSLTYALTSSIVALLQFVQESNWWLDIDMYLSSQPTGYAYSSIINSKSLSTVQIITTAMMNTIPCKATILWRTVLCANSWKMPTVYVGWVTVKREELFALSKTLTVQLYYSLHPLATLKSLQMPSRGG